MKNYYEILSVSSTATEEEIKQSYFRLSEKYNSNLNSESKLPGAELEEITEAYNILSDTDKKIEYDIKYTYYFFKTIKNEEETDYIKSLKDKANNNDKEAQFELGNSYFYGRGVKENEQEAFYWFKRAAINENIEAISFLKEKSTQNSFAAKELVYALFGLAFDKKALEIIKDLENIASGSGEIASLAQYYMGLLFFNSEVIEQNYQTAFKYFKQSLSNGYLESLSLIKWQAGKDNYIAQETLAEIYFDGIMTDKNKKEAFKWYAKAAGNESQKAFDILNKYISRDDTDAKDGLLELYINKKIYKGIVNFAKVGDNKAIDYIRNIFNGQDNEAQFEIAQIYAQLNNEQEALKWYLKSADNDNTEALNIIAEFYSQGNYGLAKDLEKTKYYYKKSADQNNEKAKKALVSIYISCNEFNEKTIKLFREEAKRGNEEASQALLEYCSSMKEINSEIVDITKELDAVNKFNSELEYKIGNVYFAGSQKIKQDYTNAFEWYQKAQKNGNKESKDVIDKALQEDNQYAQYVIGEYYIKNSNIENGFNLLIKSANQGNQDSINYLNNFIEKGSAENQYKTAQLIEQNKLPKQEILDCIKLYETSSQNGYIEATKRLAEYYQDTNKNLSNSYYIKYENQCIEQKTKIGWNEKLILADIYFTDETHLNKEKALNYYINSAKKGNEKAKKFIKKINIKTLNDNELNLLSNEYYEMPIFIFKLYWFLKRYIIYIILLILLIISISVYVYIPKGTDYQKAEIYYKRGNIEKAIKLFAKSPEGVSNKVLNDLKNLSNQGDNIALSSLKFLAERGNSDSQYYLGTYYYYKNDSQEAIKWYTEAYKQGNKEAFNEIEYLAKRRNKTAIKILENFAEQGDTPAFLTLEFLAKQENSDAQYYLGTYYYYKNDSQEAIKWYTEAYKQGNKEAFNEIEYLAKQGDSEAQFRLGYYYNFDKKNRQEGFKWYINSAKQGNEKAIKDLKYFYEYADALKTLKDLAKQGKETAIEILGNFTERGDKDAFSTLKLLAEQGNDTAQYYLGEAYDFTGIYYEDGIKKDLQKAIKWYTKSAEQGNVKAQVKLGLIYEFGKKVVKKELLQHGIGGEVHKNKQEAIKWYKKADKQGDLAAYQGLRRLAE